MSNLNQGRNGRPGGQDEPVPETPTMRSVAIAAPTSGELGSARGARPRPGLGGISAGPIGIPSPLALKNPGKPSLRSSYAQDSPLSLEKNWQVNVAVPKQWKVCSEYLEPLPDHPLERTSKFVEQADALTVSTRISEVLRDLEVDAKFDDKQAKAKCKTVDYVTFRIRLYSGRESEEGVMVECQRRSGSCPSFMRCCRAIFDAVVGTETLSESRRDIPMYMRKPAGDLKCVKGEAVDNNEECAKVALAKAISLLQLEQRDSKALGIESICYLTDPVKTFPETALQVAKCVLFGCDYGHLRELIVSLLRPDSEQDRELVYEWSMDEEERTRNMALLAISNSLALVKEDGCLTAEVKKQEWFADFLIPLLEGELGGGTSVPHDARVAAQALNHLTSGTVPRTRLSTARAG